jgi:hypothetical protein
MNNSSDESVRRCFYSSASAFSDLVGQIPGDMWQAQALGVWNIRDLVGHTSRALLTIEDYLNKPASEILLADAAEYFIVSTSPARINDVIAQRGVEAGMTLGGDPASPIRILTNKVIALVQQSPDDASVTTAWGTMTLLSYLPTRSFELTVHSIDLCRILGTKIPSEFSESIGQALELAGKLAARHPRASDLLMALTGRQTDLDSIIVL